MPRSLLLSFFIFHFSFFIASSEAADRPNIILIVADDLGCGDLGFHGNPIVKTPRLDALVRQSVELTNFHVDAVGSLSRAALLTGRYAYRTGVCDVGQGRAMMRPTELTIAKLLKSIGYRSGLFGKWHLGDCYPMRPQDHAFQEVLTFRGGGLDHYTDPNLLRNGDEATVTGYCGDIFTDAAIKFVEGTVERKQPFFAYLALNTPHTPLEPREADLNSYKGVRVTPGSFPQGGFPLYRMMPSDDLIKLYAMVTNIDGNVGRLLDALDRLKITDDTIVIFTSDNGPAQVRFNQGLRGNKGSVFEGGVRASFLLRWPGGRIKTGSLDFACSHIDVLPTLCACLATAAPSDRPIDGVNLLPALKGQKPPASRTLFAQWHAADAPQKFRNAAARGPKYKMVQTDPASRAMLFDLDKDPFEQNDVAENRTAELTQLREQYDRWFADVTKSGFAPPRIHLGTAFEPMTRLTRQDWRGSADHGHWLVTVPQAGDFDATVILPKGSPARRVTLKLGKTTADEQVPAKSDRITLSKVNFAAGDAKLKVILDNDPAGPGAWQVEIKRYVPRRIE